MSSSYSIIFRLSLYHFFNSTCKVLIIVPIFILILAFDNADVLYKFLINKKMSCKVNLKLDRDLQARRWNYPLVTRPLTTVKPLITNTSNEFIKCRILQFLIMESCRY